MSLKRGERWAMGVRLKIPSEAGRGQVEDEGDSIAH